MFSTAWRTRLTGAAYCCTVAGAAAGLFVLHQLLSAPVEAGSRKQRPPARAHRPTAKHRIVKRKAGRPQPAIGYRKVTAGGVAMSVVTIDPRRAGVRFGVATSASGLGYRDQWASMIGRTRPVAAITGTYFDTNTLLPVGLIQVGGRTVYRGGIGTAFAVRRGGKVTMHTGKPGIGRSWTGYDVVLRAGPRLVTHGKRTLFPQAEGFRDPAIFQRKPRTAVAINRSGKVMLVTVQRPVLLRTLADALRKLGAVDAMCLDGGGSTALYYRGQSLVKPARPLTNLLVVYDSEARYHRYAGKLNPNGPRFAAR